MRQSLPNDMQPLIIGSLRLENPFILAPMAGYTDLAFRLLCREFGAGLCYSEMIDCEEVLADRRQESERCITCAEEMPVAVQLVGCEPDKMAEAAAVLCERPVSVIDLNMGCPSPKITARGGGAALMDRPKLAGKIIAAVRARATVPVTVKTRAGTRQHSITAPDFATMAEEAGASAVTVHARTCSEGFSGEVDIGLLARIKKKVTIPIIANGGVQCHEGGLRLLSETGCDGVMVGRAAIGAPWIFSPNVNPLPSIRFRVRALLRHLELIERYYPLRYPLAKIKNHAWKYFKDRSDLKSLRQQVEAADSLQRLSAIVHALS